MVRRSRSLGLALGLIAAVPALAADATITPSDLAGTWAGVMTHDGDEQPIALAFEPDTGGRVAMLATIPVMHATRVPFGRPVVRAQGDSVRLGPFQFRFDRASATLSGVMPPALVPRYQIPVTLKRTDRYEPPPRPPLTAPLAAPVWERAVGSAVWAGPAFADGVVYLGTQDGRVIALEARDGTQRWEHRVGGAVRSRPVVARGSVLAQADDGWLYCVDARTGALRWKTQVVASPIVRLPFSDPKSRFDRFASDVLVHGDRLYLGTHEGKLLALDARDGRASWELATGDAILAAPALARGTLYAGSFDRHVYAVDAASGALRWKRDTGGAVVSTPALHGDRVIVGTRAYDLLALDADDGDVAWKRYVWMSWIESSPVVRDDVVYVGSSDAAAVFAVDARRGTRVWTTDVFGWSWGQPAVDAKRVYAGTSSQAGYLVDHAAGVFALDRATGRPVWRYAATAPDTGAFGFPGSPALGAGRVFVGGLDGKVLAFRQ